jgi:phosphoribosylaminoimidazolecarboxamide formyltransferase / IMP cyclohydrolase
MLPAHRALVSVSDKRGLEDLARGLQALGIEVISTGGTLGYLRDLGIPALAVSEVTGFPEILDGRVKTLHPRIHAGILADRSQTAHAEQLTQHAIDHIDLVVVNLYPFRETAADPRASFGEVIEKIDVGGPAMVRAAAKNFSGVAVVVDPDDYTRLLAALSASDGVVPEALRRELALKAFRHTASYDAAVADWLAHQLPEPTASAAAAATAPPGAVASESPFSARLVLDLQRTGELRYGENPHQGGAVYAVTGGPGALGGYRQLAGKELSWNNLLDADAARKMAALFDEPAVIIVKHNNPCGIGRGADAVAAYRRALATDPVSAFGSVIAVNGTVDGQLAAAMAELFVEVLIAPGFDQEALELFARKKNLRLVEAPPYRPAAGEIELRAIAGGFLAQPPDAFPDDTSSWTVATRRAPGVEERRALDLAWRVARYVKSNAIVLANGDQTVGIGAGQMSRVDSCRLAIQKAQLPVAGTVAASDAFSPFRDGLDVLADAGVTAVVQPGGSRNDPEVIAAADGHGMAMLLTGKRHFRH